MTEKQPIGINGTTKRELNNEIARRHGYRVELWEGERYALIAPDSSIITVSESEEWAWDNVSWRPADNANEAIEMIDKYVWVSSHAGGNHVVRLVDDGKTYIGMDKEFQVAVCIAWIALKEGETK